MNQDSTIYDTVGNRPLPKWLKDQKAGLNTIQPAKIVIRQDRSLDISFAVTLFIIIIIVGFLTWFIFKKKRIKYQ